MRRLDAVLLLLPLLLGATSARAQDMKDASPPPPAELPDVPLPRWRPPARLTTAHLMRVAPEIAHAQKLRQAGLWVSSIGWAALLGGGILWARGAELSTHETLVLSGYDENGRPIYTGRLEGPPPERARIVDAATALFSVGGALAASGFVVFTVGQTRISRWHHQRPDDVLPALSGF